MFLVSDETGSLLHEGTWSSTRMSLPTVLGVMAIPKPCAAGKTVMRHDRAPGHRTAGNEAVIYLADKCRGLTMIDLRRCRITSHWLGACLGFLLLRVAL